MKTIKLKLRHHVYVTSDDVPGLMLVADTLADLRDEIPAVIKKLAQLNEGREVEVRWTGPEELESV